MNPEQIMLWQSLSWLYSSWARQVRDEGDLESAIYYQSVSAKYSAKILRALTNG